MNKNVKRIVAMGLAIGTVSAIAPATNANLLTAKVYASSDADELTSLDLQNNDGDDIDLYTDSEYDDDLDDDLDEGKTYYAESDTKKVTIDDIDGADKDNVRIFVGSDDTDYEVGDSISLDDGTTTLKVRVYEDAYDDYDDYDDANDSDYNEYKIKVEYNEDDDSDSSDADELTSLDLQDDDNDTIKLYSDDDYDSDNKVSDDDVEEGETYYAKTSSDKVSIDIDGADEDNVRIFKGSSDKDYEVGDDISISADTTLTVKIYEDAYDDYDDNDDANDSDYNQYKIKVEYKGDDDESTSTSTTKTTTTATSTPSTATDVTTVKASQWVKVNGLWQYNDVTGKAVKNSWVQNYYVKDDGNMATGWLNYSGSWYYLGTDGAKKTGWQLVSGTWYYLDSQGKMQIGWMKDLDGKYYYLNSNGSMAHNTTIDGYKLGSNGAWLSK